jgi:16S rRNA (adenine1518-N6/adenine1519-N6)-dimethyltransferase
MHKAKKSLGQNFLKSIQALNKIVEAGEITEKDTILEIGPGKGALTEKLLEKAGKVLAVEKDDDLIEFLNTKFEKDIKSKKLILLNEDILEIQIANLALKEYKIIANIPYNITGAILKKFLTENIQPSLMVLMVQNEVAKRIVANDKKESILSVSVKVFGTPKLIMKVPARYFSPAPKVDSAVILIKDINKNLFNGEGVASSLTEEKFFRVIKAGFAHKRKVLIRNLEEVAKKEELISIFKNLDIKENTRPEDISIEKWVDIIKQLKLLSK